MAEWIDQDGVKGKPPMSLLQLYSATSGESSGDPSPCPSPIPVVPSLTTNFPLLPTSPLRYPHPLQPVFFRMATPPNTQPQRPKNNSSARSGPRSSNVESPESEGDEDREAIISLQVSIQFSPRRKWRIHSRFPRQQNKLQAISPAPESEARTSCEFDFSGLALPVPLEFADADSLQDVPLDVFDENSSPVLDICESGTCKNFYSKSISNHSGA